MVLRQDVKLKHLVWHDSRCEIRMEGSSEKALRLSTSHNAWASVIRYCCMLLTDTQCNPSNSRKYHCIKLIRLQSLLPSLCRKLTSAHWWFRHRYGNHSSDASWTVLRGKPRRSVLSGRPPWHWGRKLVFVRNVRCWCHCCCCCCCRCCCCCCCCRVVCVIVIVVIAILLLLLIVVRVVASAAPAAAIFHLFLVSFVLLPANINTLLWPLHDNKTTAEDK